jgi:hypothetical protein
VNARFQIPYALPTALLTLALLLKFPTFVRTWRDPDVRATTFLLACATAVLVVITPVNIERLNELTGIPNIASPWAYSFLTAFCATGLTMIMRWREVPSAGRRRRMRRIYWIYSGVIVALWGTFLPNVALIEGLLAAAPGHLSCSTSCWLALSERRCLPAGQGARTADLRPRHLLREHTVDA